MDLEVTNSGIVERNGDCGFKCADNQVHGHSEHNDIGVKRQVARAMILDLGLANRENRPDNDMLRNKEKVFLVSARIPISVDVVQPVNKLFVSVASVAVNQ